jgi:hypothetical protein
LKLGTLAVWFPHGLKVWPWIEGFFMAWDCGKCLVLKGFAGGQAYFDELLKYIFTYSQLVIGNLSAMIHVPCVASNNGTLTITKLPR